MSEYTFREIKSKIKESWVPERSKLYFQELKKKRFWFVFFKIAIIKGIVFLFLWWINSSGVVNFKGWIDDALIGSLLVPKIIWLTISILIFFYARRQYIQIKEDLEEQLIGWG